MTRAICAVCTAELPPGSIRTAPLGRDDAPVPICARCDDEHPRSGRYGFDDGASRSHGAVGNVVGIDGNRRARKAGGS